MIIWCNNRRAQTVVVGMAASLLRPTEPATLAKSMTDVLVQEEKEKAMNRDAIAALRR